MDVRLQRALRHADDIDLVLELGRRWESQTAIRLAKSGTYPVEIKLRGPDGKFHYYRHISQYLVQRSGLDLKCAVGLFLWVYRSGGILDGQ
jgi:hypothetical protein